jgi:hypothetical protein
MAAEQTMLTIFAGVVAVAFVCQSLALLWLARSARELSSRMDRVSHDLLETVRSLSGKAEDVLAAVKSTTEGIHGLQQSLTVTTDLVQKRVVDLDAFLDEATQSARLQMARVQDLVDTAAHRLDSTMHALNRGILSPVHEANAVAKGVRVGLEALLGKRRRRPANRSHQDEEMFI